MRTKIIYLKNYLFKIIFSKCYQGMSNHFFNFINMKEVLKSLSFTLVLSSLLILNSCKEKEPEPASTISPDKATAALIEFAKTSQQFSATVKECGDRVDETSLQETKNLQTLRASSYPIVSCTGQGNGTWLITCNYGKTLLLCPDGYYRRGIVNIVTNNFFHIKGTRMTVTFDNYYQKGDWLSDEYKIEGTQEIVNNGPNAQHPERIDYNCTVKNGRITYNTKVVHYTETTVRSWSPDTLLCNNNWYITGEWIGKSSDAVNYTLKANSIPLHYRVCCHYFQGGILNVNVEGLPEFKINYDYVPEGQTPEECDRNALIDYPGYPIPIIM